MKKPTILLLSMLMCCLVFITSCDKDPCAKGHTEVIDAAIAPTCTAKGKTEGKHCSVCNKVLVAQNEVVALGHTEAIDASIAPTCTAPGKTEGKHCSVCKEVLIAQEFVSANGHAHIAAVTAPTCTTVGYTTYTCHCGDRYVIDYVDALGHSYSTDWVQTETHHWHKATCSHTSEISEKAEHDFGGDLICDTCQFVKEADKISFKTLQVDGVNVYGNFSNATTMFSFANEIAVSGKATYYVSLDPYGMQIVVTKTVSLNSGDNTFYILEQVGEEVTLYTVVIRRRPVYSVTFDTNGGSAIESQTIEEDSYATVPVHAPTRDGYTFAGWSYDFSKSITQNTTITAHWTPNTYTITYDVSGGNALNSNTQSVTYDASYILAIPTRTGYTFAGWYNGSTKVENDTWNFVKNITLTANWTPNTYTITYELNGGTLKNTTQSVTYDAAYNLAIPTRTGYTFAGWYNGDTKVEDGTWKSTQNMTFTAKWAVNSYTVTYVVNGGENLSSQVLNYGATLPTASRSGFTFGGWFSDIALTNAVTSVPAENITLYAYWTEENKPCDFSYTGTSSITITAYHSSDASVCIPSYIGGTQVTSIGEAAFSNCNNLASIIIPDSVTSIGTSVFYGCSSLTNIVVNSENKKFMSINGNVYSKDGTNLIQYAVGKTNTSFLIPDEVTIIGNFAFEDCNNLTSIIIPNSVTSIGWSAFESCDSLTSIIIPDSVTSIGSLVLSGCNSLKVVYYTGTAEDWKKILIGTSNFNLAYTPRYYYSEAEPTVPGKYWHYVDGVPTIYGNVVEDDFSMPDVWDGTIDTFWFDKNNIQPEYTLTTAAQFAGFLQIRQDNYKNGLYFEGVTIKLGRDIILNEGTAEEIKEKMSLGQALQLPALHSSKALFKGTFDGQGHTIYGAYLNCTSSGYKAVFSGIGDNAVIKNLKFVNAYFEGAENDKLAGAIVVARALGTNMLLSNITVEGALLEESTFPFSGVGVLVANLDEASELTIENCHTSGTISFPTKGTNGNGFGGIVGFVDSGKSETLYEPTQTVIPAVYTKLTMKNCTSSATINGTDYCGGLVGTVGDLVELKMDYKCKFTGTITCSKTQGAYVGNNPEAKPE